MAVVLIVEDEATVLILAESVLQEAGYETVSASRGGPACLNRFSASISGTSAGVRLPSGAAAS
jgi:CheY-like chemotaxis protein